MRLSQVNGSSVGKEGEDLERHLEVDEEVRESQELRVTLIGSASDTINDNSKLQVRGLRGF